MNRSIRSVLHVFAFACALVFTHAAVAAPRAEPLITGPIDESRRTEVWGNVRPEIGSQFDTGPVDEAFPIRGMQILLKRSAAHQQAAEDLAGRLQAKGSPDFHRWLTPEQFADQFGVHPDDVAKVRQWLTAHGFAVEAQQPNRMTVEFSGTAGQIHEAFRTEMHALDIHGVRHIANASTPTMPSALVPAVSGFVQLTDFRPHPATARRNAHSATDATLASDGPLPPPQSEWHFLVPGDIAKIYNLNPLFNAGITGAGRTIAVLEDSDPYNAPDWENFRRQLGLDAIAHGSMQVVHPGCADPGVNSDDFETILDAEWASAAAPGANIWIAACPDSTTLFGGAIAMVTLLNSSPLPDVIEASWGNCETAQNNEFFKQEYLQGVLEGVSTVISAGDQGAGFCDYLTVTTAGITVNGYASTNYDVAVGGTAFLDFYTNTVASHWAPTPGPFQTSALGYIPETVWNDSCASTLITQYYGYSVPYGPSGFCAFAGTWFTIPFAGSGGPSNCATGVPAGPVTSDGVLPANGTCQGWPKPSWQQVVGNPNDGVRDLPDVSFFSSDGTWGTAYAVCDTDVSNYGAPCIGAVSNWAWGGGTSFAAPIMAGIQALVNQVWGRQGNPNPVLYAIGRSEFGANGNASCNASAPGGPSPLCTYRDVTVGDNDIDCIPPYNCFDPDASLPNVLGVLSTSNSAYQPAYRAGIGWDFASGLGSVNAALLVLNPLWASRP